MIWQWMVWGCGLLAVGWYGQYHKIMAEELATEVLSCHGWIDEIIKALEVPVESGADLRLDSLVAERKPRVGDSAG